MHECASCGQACDCDEEVTGTCECPCVDEDDEDDFDDEDDYDDPSEFGEDDDDDDPP